MSQQVTGVVFNIQRFSIHDGPGIRTTVFLKGCPLRCFWCHNPEGLRARPEVQYDAGLCIACGACGEACEEGAHAFDGGAHAYDRERCVQCGRCITECCAEALRIAGEEMTAARAVAECLRDRAFYGDQGTGTPQGGVTLSGGEPLLQPEFGRAVLEGLRAEGIHTAIETTAYFAWERVERFLPLLDLVMMDIKHMESERHRAATGVPNERILENARRLAASGIPLVLHTPVIPTVNATAEEIGAIARFASELQALRPAGAAPVGWELLPFHKLAGDKYRALGMEYAAANLDAPSKEHLLVLHAAARVHFPGVVLR